MQHLFIIIKQSIAGLIKVSEEVNDGLLSRKPVVALESTVITHGLPYPDNLKYAYIYLFCIIQFVNSKLILLYRMFFNDFSQSIKF